MKNVRQVLKDHGFLTKKSMGQNFLFDTQILDSIAEDAGITAQDTVVEIGPGAGTLTRQMALKAEKVVSVELDKELLPVLAETLEGLDNVTVINADFTKLDLPAFYAQHVLACGRSYAEFHPAIRNLIYECLEG